MMPQDERIRSTIAEIIANRMGMAPEDLPPDGDFGELGLTSLDAVIVTGELEERLDIEIDAALLFEHRTLASVTSLLIETLRETEPDL